MRMDYANHFPNEVKKPAPIFCDQWLLRCTLMLLAFGIVMVASSSITMAEKKMDDAFYYVYRHALFLGIGLLLSLVVFKTRISQWLRFSPLTLFITFVLLIMVLIPGIGQEKVIKGSMRWIPLGSYNLQVSELAKLFVITYIAGYLVRHSEEARSSLGGFIKPISVVMVICAMLLAEPDFGTASLIMGSTLVLLYLGGVRGSLFIGVAIVMAIAFILLVYSVPYRFDRVISLLDPWAHAQTSGYQLINSLLAFGVGGFSGVGLGAGMQKAGYLPEPHTDFLFAVIGEELGLIGTTLVIALFVIFLIRSFAIANIALIREKYFHAYLAYGIGTWISMQAFVNIGVNLGVLPTTGLTLPLMSYGGSSLITTMVAIAVLFRIDHELRFKTKPFNLRRMHQRRGRNKDQNRQDKLYG